MPRQTTLRSLALSLALVSAACTASGRSGKEKEQQVDNHTEQAQQYLAMGELDRAEGQTLKGLELDPKNVRLKVIRAKVLIKRGRPEDVLRAEKLLLDAGAGDDYQVQLCLGIAQERKGLAFDEAAAALRSGKRVTEAADPAARVAELERDATRAWRDSVASYGRCLSEHEGDTDAMNGLMRVHGLLGEKEKSLAWAEKLLETTLIDLEFWKKQMLRTEMSADEEARMRNLVKQYSELQSKTHLTASIVLHELGRDADAEAHVTQAIEIDPQQAELYGRRAELRMAQKKYDLAKQDLDTFLRHSTRPFDHPDVRRASNLLRECEEALRNAKS